MTRPSLRARHAALTVAPLLGLGLLAGCGVLPPLTAATTSSTPAVAASSPTPERGPVTWDNEVVGTLTATTATTAPKPTPKPDPTTSAPKPAPPVATLPPVMGPPSTAPVAGCGNPSPGKVMLTFDDGGPLAPALLAVLDRFTIKARWFPTGEWAAANAGFVNTLKAGGQLLGNHTLSHPQMYEALGTAELQRQITLGYHPTTVFRFPYGASDATSRALVRSAGYSICGWNIDTNDWRGNDTATITQIVTSEAKAGSVVLMHMKFQADVDALPTIITTLRARGLI